MIWLSWSSSPFRVTITAMAPISCPKCTRMLQQSGEVTIDEDTYPIYQCDECLVNDPTFGEVALTFAIGRDGKPFDPATPDGSLPI